MIPSRRGLQRIFGYAAIVAIWATLLVLLGYLGIVYAIYADLKNSERSQLTAGTGAEFVAHELYDHFRGPAGILLDEELVYVPKPGEMRQQAPEYDVPATITPEGTRQQAPAAATDGGLIVMVGDSFTFGQGVRDDQTYSALLQQRYHHNTVNTGVISYGTARELTRLRRLGLLTKASMLVIQFCSNDGRENHDFVQDPKAPFARVDPSRAWMIKQNYQYNYPELTYLSVLNAVTRHLRFRIEAGGVAATLKLLVRSRLNRIGTTIHVRDNRGGAALADDFLGVLDLFPEIADKPVIVLEMNDGGSSTGFTEALRRRAAARPNLKVVDFVFQQADFFRFDGHLKPHGHEIVAAELDRAIREWRGDAAGR